MSSLDLPGGPLRGGFGGWIEIAGIDEAYRGVIVVSAAGNARVSTQFYAPGGCQNVITVAAGDARGQIAPYSNFGDNVTVIAPGGDLTRDDNGDGRPDGVLSTKAATNCYDPVTGEGVDTCFYAYEQGTSMAAPHVSAALCGSDPGRESPASLFARLGESEWQALVDREGWKINAVENEPRSFAAYLKMITPIGAPPPMDKRLRKRRPRGPLVRDWAPDL